MNHKLINNKVTIISSLLIAVIVLATGISFAVFSAKSITATKTITSGNLSITFMEGSVLRTSGLYPIQEDDVNTHATEFNFTVRNSGDITGYFDISLTDIVIDSELKNTNFKWRLLEDSTVINEGNFVGVETSKLLQRGIEIGSSNIKTYRLLVWINESNTPQNKMQGKNLEAIIKVTMQDRMTNFATSEEPVLMNTINGNEIQDLKIYGNTVNETSVGNYDSSTRKYIIPIKVSGKNLANLNSALNKQLTILDENEQTYKLEYTASGRYQSGEINLNIEEGKTYTISADILESTANFENSNGNLVNIFFYSPANDLYSSHYQGAFTVPTNGTKTSLTFTSKGNYSFMRMYIYQSKVDIGSYVIFKNFQIEENDTATSYEPYQEPQTYEISLDSPLRSNGNTKDYIDFSLGKVIRNIDENGNILQTPTIEDITLPTITTLDSTTIISTDLTVKPLFEGNY